MNYILGISCYFHDSAACLIQEGKIIAAVQEERFSRVKNDDSLPLQSISWLLDSHHISWDSIQAIVYYEKPFLTFERMIENFLQFAPRGFDNFKTALPLWVKKKLFLPRLIPKELKQFFKINHLPPLYFSEHHLSHAASAFYPSPYEQALIVTVDGVGEWATTGVYLGNGREISPLVEIDFPHSLGLLYSAFTAYLGFKINSGEYKVMGLAPYGEPIYEELMMKELITLHEDGSYSLTLDYFGHTYHQKSYSPLLEKLFKHQARLPEGPLEQFHMDISASLQKVLERTMIHLLCALAKKHSIRQLCLAGGVALNCVCNATIARETPFKDIWIQPAAGDAGGAIGAALAFYHLHQKNKRQVESTDGQKRSELGPAFSSELIKEFLQQKNLPLNYMDDEVLYREVAEKIAQGKICGWFQGRMEFGPRALGNRSILGDPRQPKMQREMNLKIKFRESFRPFAPIALRQDAEELFEWNRSAPYMQFVAFLKKQWRLPVNQHNTSLEDKINSIRSSYPAITHLDYSARIQIVEDDDQRPISRLLMAFKLLTGRGILINTSFNIRGEPIVCTPDDAYRCFYHTAIDYLIMGNYILSREDLLKDSSPPLAREVQLD